MLEPKPNVQTDSEDGSSSCRESSDHVLRSLSFQHIGGSELMRGKQWVESGIRKRKRRERKHGKKDAKGRPWHSFHDWCERFVFFWRPGRCFTGEPIRILVGVKNNAYVYNLAITVATTKQKSQKSHNHKQVHTTRCGESLYTSTIEPLRSLTIISFNLVLKRTITLRNFLFLSLFLYSEVISINIGQAGIQSGNACWELYCLEHGNI